MAIFRVERQVNGVAHLVMDDPSRKVNVIGEAAIADLERAAARQASTWAANASLISNSSMSASESPVRASTFAIANTGPRPMRRGESPANA